MISYADLSLPQPTMELTGWLAANMSVETIFDFYRHQRFSDDLDPRQNLDWFLSRHVKLNTLFNPWGACRWAIGYFIIDEARLALLRDKTYGAFPLVMSDGYGNEITTDMFYLPAVPLAKFDPKLNLYLLVTVDERWKWFDVAAEFSITENTTTWEDLYEAIGDALGVTITVDPISPAFASPSQGLAAQFELVPMLLDWVAASVGQRIVRNLDGTICARSASSAIALMTAQSNLYRRMAGGDIALGVL